MSRIEVVFFPNIFCWKFSSCTARKTHSTTWSWYATCLWPLCTKVSCMSTAGIWVSFSCSVGCQKQISIYIFLPVSVIACVGFFKAMWGQRRWGKEFDSFVANWDSQNLENWEIMFGSAIFASMAISKAWSISPGWSGRVMGVVWQVMHRGVMVVTLVSQNTSF